MDTPVPLVLQARTMHRVVCFIRCIIIIIYIYIYNIILYHLEYNAYYVVEYIYTACIDVCIRLDAYIPPHKCLSFARLVARTRGLNVSGRVDVLDRSEFNETKMLQFSFPLAEFLCFRSQEFLLVE